MTSLPFVPSPRLRVALTGPFGAPVQALPWMDRFLEPDELRLVGVLAAGPLTLPAAAAAIATAGGRHVGPSFFDRCERRAVIDRPTPESVALADFAERLDVWSMFEGWKDVPDDVRATLAAWRLERYVGEKRPQVERLLVGDAPEVGIENAEYLLLAEAEAVIGRAEHVYLWPCDCRALLGRCRKPSAVCLRFDNDRGLGWEISRERAVEVLRQADAAGLMHTGELTPAEGHEGTTTIGSGAICNCCADCCFPHLAGEALDAVKVWPRARYVARRDPDACTLCGRCARRCPFGAFVAGREGGRIASMAFDQALCRGCGLCATGCRDEAVAMLPLDQAADRELA